MERRLRLSGTHRQLRMKWRTGLYHCHLHFLFKHWAPADADFDIEAAKNISLLPHIFLLLPSPSLPPAQLHLWSYCRWYLLAPSMGGDNFPSHLPPSTLLLLTKYENCASLMLDTVAPKDMIHAKTGGEK